MKFAKIFAMVWFILDLFSDSKESTKCFYDLLGVSKKSSLKEIQRAYRAKARETHPDKRKDDPEQAAEEFREIVRAFEVLSDKESREYYDRHGMGPGSKHPSNYNTNSQSKSRWTFHFNFGRTSPSSSPTSTRSRRHQYLYDPIMRAQILDAQSRPVLIKPNLQHFYAAICNENSGDNESDNKDQADNETGGRILDNDVLDRYVLVAFFDSSQQSCVETLEDQVLYPWPFAGYTRESTEGVWWEDIMTTLKVDLKLDRNDDKESGEAEIQRRRLLAKRFGIGLNQEGRLPGNHCPTLGFISRGESWKGERTFESSHMQTSEKFREWVWGKLKMRVTVRNKTKWPIHWWWLDGQRGKRQDDIPVQGEYTLNTFVFHDFIFRADFVTGRTLTNESALLWYTARIHDDSKIIDIVSRCFDHSGECTRWRSEGFCDPSKETFYTRENPSFREWAMENCPVTCKTSCGRERTSDVRNEL